MTMVQSKSLYWSPLGLFEFQALGVAYCMARINNLAVWETGLGKSHLAMATAAFLIEDNKIDHVLVVCERPKLREWEEDFEEFTGLEAKRYHGTVAKRAKIRKDLPQVLISTYETIRNDATRKVEVEGRRSKKLVPHVLIEALSGKRVLVVYDEMTKLGNRGSNNHKSHAVLVKHLRESEGRVMGLTATPLTRNPENIYNLGRILMPDQIGTVAQFDHNHIKSKDIFGNPATFKNLVPEETSGDVLPFSERISPILLRKRKTDDDVREQFPESMEEPPRYVDLGKIQREFYDAVYAAFSGQSDQTDRILFTLMRQIAGHPLSLVQSQGEMARMVVDKVGEDGLAAIGSAKTDALIEYLIPLVLGQGAQVVVFTFFGPSMIPLLKEALEKADMTVATNYGQMSDREREEGKAAFQRGEKQIFLTSDVGAKGINLPQASYVVEYEMSLTHANRTQRFNRIHRINSEKTLVTFQSLIARGTVEEAIAELVLKRNEWSDKLLEDDDPGEHHITAQMRKEMFQRARKG